jgi:hypothetical protein
LKVERGDIGDNIIAMMNIELLKIALMVPLSFREERVQATLADVADSACRTSDVKWMQTHIFSVITVTETDHNP